MSAVFLAGCSPQFTCRYGPVQNSLAEYEDEHREVSANISRGYALHRTLERVKEPYTVSRRVCEAFDINGDCTLYGTRSDTEYRFVWRETEQPVSIDLAEERARRDTLSRMINDLQGPAENEYNACLASHQK